MWWNCISSDNGLHFEIGESTVMAAMINDKIEVMRSQQVRIMIQ